VIDVLEKGLEDPIRTSNF